MTLNITEPTVGGSSGSWGQTLNDALTAIVAYVNALEAGEQPSDSDLAAIAALTTTTFGRALLTMVDAPAARTALGLGTAATQASSAFDAAGAATTAQAAAIAAAATDATTKANAAAAASQPVDSDLTAIAALSTTAFGRSFLDRADATAARTLLGLGSAATANTSAFDAAGAASTAQTASQAYADTGDATRLLKGNVTTKTANYTAAIGDIVLADTTSATFTVTIPAASGGKGRIVVKWVKGTTAPTINLTGSDHVNTSAGVQTFTPTLLAQGYQLESDGTSLWAVTADDLPLSLLDSRYAPAGNYVAAPVGGDPVGGVPTKQGDGSVAYATPVDSTARTTAALASPGGYLLGLDYTKTDGTLNQPWKPAPALTGNLATAGTLAGTLPYSFTSSAVGQTIRVARVDITQNANGLTSAGQPLAVRVLFTVDIPATSAAGGNGVLTVSQALSNGTTITALTRQVASSNSNIGRLNYKSMVELWIDASNTTYVDVNFAFPNNYTGTMTLRELDVRIIDGVSQQLMRIGGSTTSADTATGTDVSATFATDVAVKLQDGRTARIRQKTSGEPFNYNDANVFLDSAYKSLFAANPDQPGMDSADVSTSNNNGDTTMALFNPSTLHITNNDIVLSVLKGDGSAYELRCNVHGGETALTGTFSNDYVIEYDRGYGTWDRCHGDNQSMFAYRARHTLKTKVAHSDNSQVFANITRVYTHFADGVVRVDRTITFTQNATVGLWIYIMNTLPVAVPMRGRMGFGQQVLKEMRSDRPFDVYPAPNQNTKPYYQVSVTTTTASGATSLPVTGVIQQINPGWVGSLITIGTGGTAEVRRVVSTNGTSLTLDTATANSHSAGEPVFQNDEPTTLNSAATAGATTISTVDTIANNGYFIIEPGTPREERRHCTASPSTAGTPYTITFGEALVYNHPAGSRVQPIYTGDDYQVDGRVEWCAYQEPQYQAVFGQIFDRRAITSHGVGTRLQTELQHLGGGTIHKAYTKLKPTTAEASVASGTVISDTFFWYYYVPRANEPFHQRIASLAGLTPAQRAAAYPAT